jgi:hypothetical protein
LPDLRKFGARVIRKAGKRFTLARAKNETSKIDTDVSLAQRTRIEESQGSAHGWAWCKTRKAAENGSESDDFAAVSGEFQTSGWALCIDVPRHPYYTAPDYRFTPKTWKSLAAIAAG